MVIRPGRNRDWSFLDNRMDTFLGGFQLGTYTFVSMAPV